MKQKTQQRYVLGHAPEELRRLILQAGILRPITARLLHDAGIGPGMRVLDLGCGVGDVTMLLADMVGPSGSIVGIDHSPQAIALALLVASQVSQLALSIECCLLVARRGPTSRPPKTTSKGARISDQGGCRRKREDWPSRC